MKYKNGPLKANIAVEIKDPRGDIIVESVGEKFVIWFEMPDFHGTCWEKSKEFETLSEAMAQVAWTISDNVKTDFYKD